MTRHPDAVSKRRMPGLALRTQRGAAQLFITIVLLVVIMMLGITATILSSTQFKLAGNLQFENVAFNRAEAAAAVALGWLATGTNALNAGFTAYSSGSTPQLYPSSSSVDPLALAWTDSNSLAVVANDDTRRYVIQRIAIGQQPFGTDLGTGGHPLAKCPKGDLFRITARGTSAKGTSKVIQTNAYIPNPTEC